MVRVMLCCVCPKTISVDKIDHLSTETIHNMNIITVLSFVSFVFDVIFI